MLLHIETFVISRLVAYTLLFGRYREKNMISVFVNLFASIAYVCSSRCIPVLAFASSHVLCIFLILVVWQWARLASHANGDVGPAANIVTYKYLDYMATCPLLVSKTGSSAHHHMSGRIAEVAKLSSQSCVSRRFPNFRFHHVLSASLGRLPLGGCSDRMTV